MYIDCLWVSGSFKGHGYSTELLDACIADSKEKGRKGLCILSSAKKKPFLADPKFLKYKGFEVCDEADNGIQLWYLPFDKKAGKPAFKECAKHPHIDEKAMCFITQTSVHSMLSMFLSWKKPPRRTAFHSKQLRSRAEMKLRTHLLLSQHILSSVMAST